MNFMQTNAPTWLVCPDLFANLDEDVKQLATYASTHEHIELQLWTYGMLCHDRIKHDTPPKFNIDREKWWLEDDPFLLGR